MISRNTSALKLHSDTKQIAFYVPLLLDLSKYPTEWHNSIRYILNLIHWKTCCCWQADEDGFVYLKYDYITKVIPKECWTSIRKRLEGDGVLECDGLWKAGVRSLGYRLLPPFLKTHRVVCNDETFSGRVLAVQRTQEAVLLPVHRWLRYNLTRLDFDRSRAQNIITGMHPDPESPLTTSEYRNRITEACQRLASGDRSLARDRFGRVHTPVTSLPRQLRCCLSVDGQSLVGVDLANSQPLIAGIVARQFYRNRSSKTRLRRSCFLIMEIPIGTENFGTWRRRRCASSRLMPGVTLAPLLIPCRRHDFRDSPMS
jgi:hypothetical protein